MAGPVEKLDENEWWAKIKQLKDGSHKELVVKRNFGRDGTQTLIDMAHQQELYFHAYDKGKTLVFSKVPLPVYRADLDERHGSNQKEIKMSTETERRVKNLLARSKETLTGNDSAGTSSLVGKQAVPNVVRTDFGLTTENRVAKERFSVELWDLQTSKKATPSARAMQSFRERLPAYKVKDDFLKAVANNQVLVVSGETGCGKTTQLPQFILEEEIVQPRGSDCSIICTNHVVYLLSLLQHELLPKEARI